MTSLEKKKRCMKCNINKPLSKFFKRGGTGIRKHEIKSRCKDCQKEYIQNIYSKTKKYKETARKSHWVRNNINITIKEYKKKFKDQNECCNLCGRHESEFNKKLSVDHNHKTGNVRGLVCNYCNYLIMVVEEWDKKIDKYLKMWRK